MALMTPAERETAMYLAGMQMRARHIPGQPYEWKHGWIPLGATLETAQNWHASLAGLAPLIRTVHSGEVSRERLPGGQMGETWLVTHVDRRKTVAKTMHDVSDTMGHELGDPERQADAEQLAAALGKKIGAPVPAVLRVGLHRIHAEYVPGTDEHTEEETLRAKDTDAGVKLGLFDILTGAWDRPDNWVLTNKGPVGIDHSFAFWDGGDPEDAPPGGAIGPFAEHFVSFPNGYHADWDRNPLTPADIAWLRQKLTEVKPEFDEAGRSDMFAFASARLEAIAPFARGSRSRFAT